jgi:2-polyprenyl-6-methoxyphenol hydroxylase-like FAD-dependent oxidoreductase
VNSLVETEVIVVGGGLTGLAAAAFLAQHGTRVLLAERHPSTSRHAKARLVNVRSMELYRALGVEDAVRAAGEPNAGFVLADTLAGEHEAWIPPPPDEVSGGDLSPTESYSCDQQRIEPILRARAVELGADVRFGTTATSLTEHGDGVAAALDGPGAATVHARYAVAADGADSPLRTSLAIGRHGEPVEGTAVSVLFRADLGPALRGRRVDALLSRAAGAFLFARGNAAERKWQLGTYLRPEWDPQRVDAYVGDVVRAATGLPELDPLIEGVQTWTSGAYVADRLRRGRVFLVGDAAHVMPPYGGFGGNTGVQDAHNLAWKLAAVCRGDAPDALLDTYEAERAPIAQLTVEQALLRSRKVPGQPPPTGQIDATTLVLGFCYPGGHASAAGLVEDPGYPSGRPGTRAPHVELADGRSLLDLFDPTAFTAVHDPDTAGWSRTHRMREVGREQVARRHQNRWAAVYGGRTVLVRPDGVIAASDRWR